VVDQATDRLVTGSRAAGLTVIGTGGLLVTAKTRSAIPLVTPLLEQPQAAGYHLSDELTRRILELAGEGR
jgi:predicted nucleic acid-binding protein